MPQLVLIVFKGEFYMRVTIDRFEGEFAVVETQDCKMANIPKILVPDADEGDVVIIEVDKERTSAAEKKIKELMDDLFE